MDLEPWVDREIFLNAWDVDTLIDLRKAVVDGTVAEWLADGTNKSELEHILGKVKEQENT